MAAAREASSWGFRVWEYGTTTVKGLGVGLQVQRKSPWLHLRGGVGGWMDGHGRMDGWDGPQGTVAKGSLLGGERGSGCVRSLASVCSGTAQGRRVWPTTLNIEPLGPQQGLLAGPASAEPEQD